jgi:hypothetical protein
MVIIEKIKELKGIRNTMVASLAEMRRSFKAYAMNVVHLGYDLRPPLFSSIDKAAHKQGKIPELLEGLRYLESLEKVFICYCLTGETCPLLILNLRALTDLILCDHWKTRSSFTWSQIC